MLTCDLPLLARALKFCFRVLALSNPYSHRPLKYTAFVIIMLNSTLGGTACVMSPFVTLAAQALMGEALLTA